MTERRYNDDEIAEILALATREGHPSTSGSGETKGGRGLTLADLQTIATDVGIAPERIAEAARALQRRGHDRPPERLLGAPRSVAYSVALPGPLDDEAWEQLVAELRLTFGAAGEVSSVGSLRTWRNGNLQVHVERDGDAWRLRMETRKEDAEVFVGAATAMAGIGALMIAVGSVGDFGVRELMVGGTLVGTGGGVVAWMRTRLTHWAARRAEQMAHIGERVRQILPPSPGRGGDGGDAG